jgi:hypothetical protein
MPKPAPLGFCRGNSCRQSGTYRGWTLTLHHDGAALVYVSAERPDLPAGLAFDQPAFDKRAAFAAAIRRVDALMTEHPELPETPRTADEPIPEPADTATVEREYARRAYTLRDSLLPAWAPRQYPHHHDYATTASGTV